MNILKICAGDKRIENTRWNFSHTHTQTHTQLPATSKQNYVEIIVITVTHLLKWAVSILPYLPSKTNGITLSYSPPNTLHPQIIVSPVRPLEKKGQSGQLTILNLGFTLPVF